MKKMYFLLSITESISNFFLRTVGKELCVFFCSMIPIIELRGAIPLAASLGVNPFLAYGLSIVGNMIPVPFILLFIKAIIGWMQKSKVKMFSRFGNFLIRKGEKNKEKVSKYGFWGLALFVMIPLPGTGAWTGSLVAALLEMPFWKAVLSALVGVLCAGIIMSLISYGIGAIIALF